MKTAIEMYDYCVENGYGKGFNRNNSIKHFTVIQKALLPDEDVLCVFIGLHNYISPTKHDNNFAYAITNKRIIMGQKKVVGQTSQVVLLDNVNDITFSSGIAFGKITIDTIKEEFNVAVAKQFANNIYSIVLSTFNDLKHESKTSSSKNSLQQIKELKELLDIGAITQKEFELKKRKLLNL